MTRPVNAFPFVLRQVSTCHGRHRRGIFSLAVALVVFAVLQSAAVSRAATWDGNGAPPDGDGLWTTGDNWNPNGVPAGVSADINLNGADVLLNDGSTQTIAGLQLAVPNNVTATLGVSNGSVINVNGGLSMATGGTGSNASLTMNSATFNGVNGGEWVRRGGTASVTMTNSTINSTSGLAWAGANAPEGPDTLNLSMTNSKINLSSGGISIGNALGTQKVNITTFDATSEINIAAGGILLNGGSSGNATVIDGTTGWAIYNLPLAEVTATPGKMYALNKVTGMATSSWIGGPQQKVALILDAVGTSGVRQSDATLTWNGGFSLATGGDNSRAYVSLNGITINGMGGSNWARRGGRATLDMTDSTINVSGQMDIARFTEGTDDRMDLNLIRSVINLSSGSMLFGDSGNNQRVFLNMDSTSEINIAAGHMQFNGGNTSQAAVGDTPAGTMIYNIPFADSSGTPGKVYSHQGFRVATLGHSGLQNHLKVELNVTDSGAFASDPSLDFHGGALVIGDAANAGVQGRVNIDDVDISGVSSVTITRRTNNQGTLSIKDATFSGASFLLGFGEGTGERARLLLDNATVNSASGQFTNRNQANASTEIRGTGSINVTGSNFRNDGRVVADGDNLTIGVTGGIVTSANLTTAQTHFGQAGWYATAGSGLSKLTLPGLTSVGAGKTWGEDPNDTTPDLVNSVRFYNVVGLTGTLNGSLLAVDHNSIPAGLVNPIGVWDFSTTGPFTSAEMTIRYDDLATNLANIIGGEAALKLFHFVDGLWVDITEGPVDMANNRIDSIMFTSLSPFAVAEDALNPSGVPEPSTYALGLIGLVALGGTAWRRKYRGRG